MDKNVWTAEAVQNAVLQDSKNLEIVFSNYLKAFIGQLAEYDISLQGINSIDQLHQKVVDGIELLEPKRKEFLSVVEMFAGSKHPFLKQLTLASLPVSSGRRSISVLRHRKSMVIIMRGVRLNHITIT